MGIFRPCPDARTLIDDAPHGGRGIGCKPSERRSWSCATRMERIARCACCRVTVSVENDPIWVATCHCDFCQKRTGSVFQVGAYFAPDERLLVTGETKVYNGLAIDGIGTSKGNGVSYHFCTTCGSTVYWILEGPSAFIAIAVGSFADPEFAAPVIEAHTAMRHRWVPPIPGAEQFEGFPS